MSVDFVHALLAGVFCCVWCLVWLIMCRSHRQTSEEASVPTPHLQITPPVAGKAFDKKSSPDTV
jgi:hypothetical protein